MNQQTLEVFDPIIAEALTNELRRQESGLEMIPSENFLSLAALEALGSVATNKYAEGYPGKRYYGGCEYIDIIEETAIERAKELFGAEHVNIQPLSGAPMNVAVYFGLLEPGDIILGMDLSHGGHLTHGHPVTYMAKIFNFIRYKTNEKGLIDLSHLRAMAIEHRPKMILVGYSAYSREIDYAAIKQIADEVGAITMADVSHIGGLIAGQALANPVPIFDVVTTTTHKTMRGARGGMILCKKEFAKKIDKAVFPGLQGGPHENNIAATAVALKEAQTPEYREYCQQILRNAKVLEQEFKSYQYRILFGQTDNHLLLIDVTPKGITGKQAEVALDRAGITINKNMIPDDPRSPMDPSGIRLGTPALTTRGMKEPEMKLVAEFINRVLSNYEDQTLIETINNQVKQLTTRFPLYPELN